MCNKVNAHQINIHYFFFFNLCELVYIQDFLQHILLKLFNVPNNF